MNFITLFLALFASLLVSVTGAPASTDLSELEKRDFIADVLNAFKVGLVTQINAKISLDSLTTNLISVDIEIKNPLIFELTIDRIVSASGLNGTTYATFDHTFEKPVVVPALKTVNSGSIPNVLLVKGALASLDIIPVGKLDIIAADVYIRALTINGKLGIPIPIEGLRQADVPASYELALG